MKWDSRKRTYWILLAVVIVVIPLFVRTGCKNSRSSLTDSKGEALYQCSMHPTIVSSKPDNCPICGMKLTRVEQGSKLVSQGKGKILYYRHPMRPDITSPKPAKDEMGMDYVPVYEEEASPGGAIQIPGHAEVFIPPERQQLIGVQTAVVEERPLVLSIRTVGRVAHDPELYSFLSEYKEAVSAKEKMKDSPLPEIRERAEALVRSAGLKLKLLGLSEDQISELLKAKDGAANLLLSSETAWIYADIYEYEAGLVKPGQAATITTAALPGMRFEGSIKSVDAVLNAMSRTLRARIEVPNMDSSLKPEMFVDVAIDVPLGTKLAIPEEALLDAGQTQLSFVDKGEGHLEPREIHVGYEAGGYYEVLSGLSPGEKVVSSANFLIDSESRLRAAAQGSKGSHSRR